MQEGRPEIFPGRSNRAIYKHEPCPDGCVRFKHSFKGEQEHIVEIDGVRLSVYSLHEDLAGRYPFMGDLHVHTTWSDGCEAPEMVAANFRKKGYDFMAITDHRNYYPSLLVKKSYDGVPIDLNLVEGEEVHLPGTDVHMVNFGSAYSVNALLDTSVANKKLGTDKQFRARKGAECPEVMTEVRYFDEVKKLAAELKIPEGIEPIHYAVCAWITKHVRKGGGLSIFAHPYWITSVYQLPDTFTDYMLETQPFDAFEVLGGEPYFEQNGQQAAKYYDDRRRGRNYPIVGSSDSHCSLNDATLVAKTIVFSSANERTALIQSVKDYYSVAVDCLVKDIGLVGDLRLVRYGGFLLRNYFPLHDVLCAEEGRAMLDHMAGRENGKPDLEYLHGRTDRMLKRYFCFGK